jgi:thiol-disulfide isomerase/thioredoxin
MNPIATIALLTGIWRAVLTLPNGELPFNFELQENESFYTITIMNGEERIKADEIRIKDDSLFLRLPVYDSEIKVKFTEREMKGVWVNYSRKTNQSIPFKAEFGLKHRFVTSSEKTYKTISGTWEAWFSPGTKDSSLAVGIFNQNAKEVTGTFLTQAGDHRFLQGITEGDSMFLSCFDGSHAFLFKSKITGDENEKMNGTFLSGNHWKEDWVAKRNDNIELPNPDSITFLKPEYKTFNFSFADFDSNLVKLTDKKFTDKVKVIQILGSWCPNCLDESAYLAGYYKKNNARGVEIIGISFEKTNDFQKAVANVQRLKDRYGIKYTLLLAGNRDNVATALPMINRIMGYPTTIFIDKKNKVRKIHTGFSGPATGIYYEKFKDDFEAFMDKLIAE